MLRPPSATRLRESYPDSSTLAMGDELLVGLAPGFVEPVVTAHDNAASHRGAEDDGLAGTATIADDWLRRRGVRTVRCDAFCCSTGNTESFLPSGFCGSSTQTHSYRA